MIVDTVLLVTIDDPSKIVDAIIEEMKDLPTGQNCNVSVDVDFFHFEIFAKVLGNEKEKRPNRFLTDVVMKQYFKNQKCRVEVIDLTAPPEYRDTLLEIIEDLEF